MNAKFDLSGNALKIIACVTMLIDHTGVALVGTWLTVIGDADLYHTVYQLYMVMRGIGRLAFPLYIFLLVEGFFHTHSRIRYLGRLSLFLLISEIPFDLALYLSEESVLAGTFWYTEAQNIYFTLVIGFLGMLLMEMVRTSFPEGWKAQVLMLLIMLLCCVLALNLSTDYVHAGVLAIFAAYFLRNYSKELQMAVIVILLFLMSSSLEIVALVDVLLVHFYHGNRGRNLNKWVFYAFYPVHLLILFVLKMVLF